MPKIFHFVEFLKTWSLRSNSITRQVSFNRTKFGGKCQNSKNSNATFWVIFKHSVIHWSMNDHLTCLIRCLITRTSSLWAESKDGNSPWWDDILSKTTPWRLTNRFKVRFSSLNSYNDDKSQLESKYHCLYLVNIFE